MTLRENNNNIIKLLEDIKQYKHKDRDKLFENYVYERLSKSLENYQKRINYEAYYLQYKNELRLLRNINALRKKNDL